MKRLLSIKKVLLGICLCATQAFAQTATVDLNTTAQVIRGFGGINVPEWAGDLTAAQRETAFGNGAGQLGMSVLRIFVNDDKNQWSKALPTAKRAQALGLIIFASPWNPPASMTETFTRNGVANQKRLKTSSYAAYAQHLIDFVQYMKTNGVTLYAISVQNEPDWGSEWTWWTPQEMLNFMKNNAGEIKKYCRVMAPESLGYVKSMSDPILNDAQALGNMDILGTHLYGTAYSNFPYPLFKQKGAGKELWMTEVYHPNSNANSADNWPEALETGKHIHSAMADAEFQTYVWWYIRRQYSPMKEDGTISKRGYMMAHYSKFVRSGYYRVDATKVPTTDLYLSAYKNGNDVVMVVINKNTSAKNLTISIPNSKVTTWERYVTTGSANLAKEANVNGTTSLQLTIPAESITTFVGTASTCTTPSAPTVSSATVSYCQGAVPVALSATGTSLKWYTAATGGTASTTAPVPSTGTSGTTTYYVSQTVNSCESNRTPIAVTVNTKPNVSITASGATTICQGVGVTLTATTGTGFTYVWKNSSNTQVGTNANTYALYYTSGTYRVEVTDANSCKDTSNSITVTINANPPTPTITGDSVMCNGAATKLISSATTGNQWYLGSTAISNEVSNTLDVSTVGKYSVTVTGTNGCKSTSATRTVSNNVNCNVTQLSNSVYDIESITLTPNPFTEKGIQVFFNKNNLELNYSVADLKGQIVEKGKVVNGGFVGNKLPLGEYLITFENENKTSVYKVVKH
ncbi:MAG: glycoside hydrolase family 30 beta sandwich domain-containing protein [Cytophagales bacterium]